MGFSSIIIIKLVVLGDLVVLTLPICIAAISKGSCGVRSYPGACLMGKEPLKKFREQC